MKLNGLDGRVTPYPYDNSRTVMSAPDLGGSFVRTENRVESEGR